MRRILCVLMVFALSEHDLGNLIDAVAGRQHLQHLEFTVGQNLVRRRVAGMGLEDHRVDQLRVDEAPAAASLRIAASRTSGSLSFVT